MTIISHKGFLEYGENSVMGIISALHRQGKVEFDIFFLGKQWVLAHDLNAIHSRTESLRSLFKTLKQSPIQKGMLVVDIKWDNHFNKKHNFKKALELLSMQIPKEFISRFDWYYQVSYPILSSFLICSDLKGKKGLILEDFSHQIHNDIDYLMVDVRFFCQHDLKNLKNMFPKKILIGFTCPSASLLPMYKSFFPDLSFLVVDLRLSDLDFLNKK